MSVQSVEVELLAIGAGPSNLGLAVALEELAPELAANSLLIDRNSTIAWQQGMLMPWATSQVSFLKDLVTQRDPTSRFSFLNHLFETGRMDEFVNMSTFTPYRVEFTEYLRWVAGSLEKVRIELGKQVVSMRARRDEAGVVTGWVTTLADGSTITSRYLVYGGSREANIPPALADLPPNRVVHSTQYRQRVAELSGEMPYRVAVVGSSQSAAEIFRALRDDLPDSDVAWLMRSIGLSSDQSSKFTNELYYPAFVDEFYDSRPEAREQILREMHRTNYSVVTPPMLEHLYNDLYLDRFNNRNERRLITMVDITSARETGDELVLELTDRRTGTVTELHRDVVFLGTGFDVRMPRLVRELASDLELDRIDVTREYQLELGVPSSAACYLQGVNEQTHGISDTLLSVLAQRAEEICRDIIAHRERIPAAAVSGHEVAGL
ncbi:SidA/IucD/PvdA family monooxygenase [Streptomyces sp. SID13031]|uniref:SidA/IucD/PvdA family monooxygenase n=1 Tax=Streptomyces sp. SID13031 TaxID=2706046 RepID=UPI0013CA42E0|nr:SidA/IucD/PvdA family monooxygenase [Streptomyces sp. SID13031]NEA30255.1 SidA/IucD/PvdA family monooxygenase [Streptomyces sp. SID13031]